MELYKSGEGVWYAYQMDGTRTETRHCIDYIFAADALYNDLTATQKKEMNGFVQKELFTRDWMRAMSLKDEAAAITRRTDHGPTGSFDPWIPFTVAAMWRMGDTQAAYDFYRRTAVVTREGSFTQAHEYYGPTWNLYDAPVRISNDKGCMRGIQRLCHFLQHRGGHFLWGAAGRRWPAGVGGPKTSPPL